MGDTRDDQRRLQQLFAAVEENGEKVSEQRAAILVEELLARADAVGMSRVELVQRVEEGRTLEQIEDEITARAQEGMW
jgi:hypothetical protein